VSSVPVPIILDNLIAQRRIPPLVAIMIGNISPMSRATELPCSARFADFLANEAVPWVRENYHATSDPALTFVAGSSYGGLAAAFAAFHHPEVFDNVLSQSGSFWWAPDGDSEAEWLAKQFATSPKLPIRFYFEVGLLETEPTPSNGPSQVVANRHFRDVLECERLLTLLPGVQR
jgi:enterochelin esterase family protein